ncbi:MAG: glycosyltransferase [Acidobacteriota bacterium]
MTPRVTVFLFCKNRARTIRRSVESVLAQTYQDIEYIIQDGASTDGTLEVLREYDDPRISLRSEPDSGPAAAFWQTLRRCGGDYVCACLSDEELLPDAVAEAVAALESDRNVAAVTRDTYLTDIDGRVVDTVKGRPFHLLAYMANRFCPHFSAATFRRTSLELAGLQTRDWNLDCGEFELWCRLALVGAISYLPGVASKYGQHDRQLSRIPANVSRLVQGRLRAIADLAAETGLFEGRSDLLQACRIGTVLSFADDLKHLGARREAVAFCLTVADESSRLPEPRLAALAVDGYIRIARGRRMDGDERTALDILEVAWRLMPSEASLACEIAQAYAADGRIDLAFDMYEAAIRLAPELLDVHWERGVLLERRGQIDEALESWRASDLRRDARRHSLYLAAALKSPGSTNESLLVLQQEWASYHTPREP